MSKTITTVQPDYYLWRIKYDGDDVGFNYDHNYSQLYNKTRTRTGNSMPGYRNLIRNGDSATTVLSASEVKWDSFPGFVSAWRTKFPGVDPRVVIWKLSGDFHIGPGVLSPPTISDATASSQALASLNSKIRALQTQMSGQVFLGELGQTLRMLRSPAKTLFESVGGYLSTLSRKKRGRHTPNSLKRVLEDTWLEYSFGWIPLISDCRDAVSAVNHVMGKSPPKKRVRAKGFDQITSSDLTYFTGDESPVKLAERVRTREECMVLYVAGVRSTRYPSSFADTAIASFGLTVQEFVPTAWELLPWSFLVDYFVNVGDILSAVSLDTSSVTWVSKTVVKRVFLESHALVDSAPTLLALGVNNNPGFDGTPGSVKAQYKTVERSPTSSLVPSLRVKFPGLGSLKWLNMAALLPQLKRLTPFF